MAEETDPEKRAKELAKKKSAARQDRAAKRAAKKAAAPKKRPRDIMPTHKDPKKGDNYDDKKDL